MARIMTVDDEPDVRFVIREILEKDGHEVIEAGSCRECLQKLRKGKPDLILLDIMMPGMDGWETLEKIRSDEATKSIPIAMVTVKSILSEKLERGESMKELADYIEKPLIREKFLERVRTILDTITEVEKMRKRLEAVRKTQLNLIMEEYETQVKQSLQRNIRIVLQEREDIEQKVFRELKPEKVQENEARLMRLRSKRGN